MYNYILDDNNNPVREDNIHKWGQWFQNNTDKRVVKKTQLPDGVQVSTVFLGMDHNYMGGKPILFETMIFGGEHDEYQERYSTWEEAEEGHDKAITLVYS